MTKTQLTAPCGPTSVPFAVDSAIAYPLGLNPMWIPTDEPANDSVIGQAVTKIVNALFPRSQRKSPVNLSRFSYGAIASYYDENVYVIDATLHEKIQDSLQQFEAPKDLKSHIRGLMQLLRIPIKKDVVDKLVMKIEGTNQVSNEISEEESSGPYEICSITGLEIKLRRMRDAVHNVIYFKKNVLGCILWKIIQSPYFQRLRDIYQLGVSEVVYPGATHTRFQHSLGVYHNACMLLDILRELRGSKFNEKRAEVTMVAALLHDIGHGPSSHAFEGFCTAAGLKGAEHEAISKEIILNSDITVLLNAYREGFAVEVAEMVSEDIPKDIYASLVSSQFDADRLDYLQRDQLMTGTENSIIDLTWLLANIEVKSIRNEIEPNKVEEIEVIVFNSKAKLAIQTYILALFNLYHSVYFHPVTRAAEQVFKHLMLRIYRLVQQGDLDKIGLSVNHPIMKFMQNPNNSENLLNLNDKVIRVALVDLMDSVDPIVADLASRFKNRRLPKAFDIRDRVEDHFLGDEFEELTIEEREKLIDGSAQIFKNRTQAFSKELDEEKQFWFDSGSRVAYKSISEEPGKLNTIQVLKNRKIFGIEELSELVNVAGVYKFDRVYLPFEDEEFLNYLNTQITTCCMEVSANGLQSK